MEQPDDDDDDTGHEPEPAEPEAGRRHEFPFTEHGGATATQAAKNAERPDAAYAPDPRWDEFQLSQHEWALKIRGEDGPLTVEYVQGDESVVEQLLAALGRDGCAVVTSMASADTIAAVQRELAPYAATTGGRVGAVVARSPAAHPVVSHPLLMKLCDALIGRQVLRMDADSCARLTRSRPGVSEGQGGTGAEGGAAAGSPPAGSASAAAPAAEPAAEPKTTKAEEGEDGLNLVDGTEGEASPSENGTGNNNVSSVLQQLPWGLDKVELVQRAGGAPAGPLQYNGQYCLWEMHDICEIKLGTLWALEAGGFSHQVVVGSDEPRATLPIASPVGYATSDDSLDHKG